ncbi:hypothetical protein OFN97_07455 [Campylobacter sp. VBCF_05 NA6]|uniref:hypothetical protein n=1 Tax=unclassified Campylobacter TaxID=2593542 RepID=UPI0022E9D569|nr:MULTISPECIES: hypothetical protein [unclassified Campylobacter]MDA3058269.1 hypothetical protein [Campylobacter sp. VBCF_04 NA7]MDA3059839.1 hypothetical protein [Campylobacter sp. VBCF_05 NA6]
MATTLNEIRNYYFNAMGRGLMEISNGDPDPDQLILTNFVESSPVKTIGHNIQTYNDGTIVNFRLKPLLVGMEPIKIDKNAKYFNFIIQELFELNSHYACGAWEINRAGDLNYRAMIILEDNPLTFNLFKSVLDFVMDSVADVNKILYMLETGEPVPENFDNSFKIDRGDEYNFAFPTTEEDESSI